MNKDVNAKRTEVDMTPVNDFFTVVKDENTFGDDLYHATFGTMVIPGMQDKEKEKVIERIKRIKKDVICTMFAIATLVNEKSKEK